MHLFFEHLPVCFDIFRYIETVLNIKFNEKLLLLTLTHYKSSLNSIMQYLELWLTEKSNQVWTMNVNFNTRALNIILWLFLYNPKSYLFSYRKRYWCRRNTGTVNASPNTKFLVINVVFHSNIMNYVTVCYPVIPHYLETFSDEFFISKPHQCI